MKKTLIFIIIFCIAISIVGCCNLRKDNAIVNVYTGELLSIYRENEIDIVKIKISDGTEIDFTFTGTTKNETPSRNFIPGQQIEIRCEEHKDSNYRPIISIKIL